MLLKKNYFLSNIVKTDILTAEYYNSTEMLIINDKTNKSRFFNFGASIISNIKKWLPWKAGAYIQHNKLNTFDWNLFRIRTQKRENFETSTFEYDFFVFPSPRELPLYHKFVYICVFRQKWLIINQIFCTIKLVRTLFSLTFFIMIACEKKKSLTVWNKVSLLLFLFLFSWNKQILQKL